MEGKSAYSVQEKIKLYENENKLLRKQLNEQSKTAENEIQNLKEKLFKEIDEINKKELEFKTLKQILETNYEKINKTKAQIEKKNGEYEEENNKIKNENQILANKIKEMNQEMISMKKNLFFLESNKNDQVSDFFIENNIKISFLKGNTCSQRKIKGISKRSRRTERKKFDFGKKNHGNKFKQ